MNEDYLPILPLFGFFGYFGKEAPLNEMDIKSLLLGARIFTND
jgi:hypothetical protein